MIFTYLSEYARINFPEHEKLVNITEKAVLDSKRLTRKDMKVRPLNCLIC